MSGAFVPLSEERQLADEIRRRIRAGVWGDRLPGVFRLAREFGVGRALVVKAVRSLIASGEVTSPGRRKAMRIAPVSGRAASSGTLIVHSQAEGVMPTVRAELIAELSRRMPGPVALLRVDNGLSPEEVAAKVGAGDADIVLMLDHFSASADALIAAGRRVVMLGGLGPPGRAPRVVVRAETLVREAFRRAFAAGHRRVSLPLWRRTPESDANYRAWVAAAYAEAGLPHRPEFDAPLVPDRTPESLIECLSALFRHTPPTAVVLQDSWQWFGAISVFAKLRLRVPEDVSTIMLAPMEELEAYRPAQTHFDHAIPSYVRQVKRALRAKPGAAPQVFPVEPAWVPGGTLAPPERR